MPPARPPALPALVRKSRDFEVRRAIRLLKRAENDKDKDKFAARLARLKALDAEALLATPKEELDDVEKRILARKEVAAALAAAAASPTRDAVSEKPKSIPAGAEKTLKCPKCDAMFASEEARGAHLQRRHAEEDDDDVSYGSGDNGLGRRASNSLVKKNRMGQRERKKRALEAELAARPSSTNKRPSQPLAAKEAVQASPAVGSKRPKPKEEPAVPVKSIPAPKVAPVVDEKLHPSWAAAKRRKQEAFHGTKVVFDEE